MHTYAQRVTGNVTKLGGASHVMLLETTVPTEENLTIGERRKCLGSMKKYEVKPDRIERGQLWGEMAAVGSLLSPNATHACLNALLHTPIPHVQSSI